MVQGISRKSFMKLCFLFCLFFFKFYLELTGYVLIFRDKLDSPSFTTLGTNGVISGLEKGLSGMCEGERREVVVPPHWGHGENGGQSLPSLSSHSEHYLFFSHV